MQREELVMIMYKCGKCDWRENKFKFFPEQKWQQLAKNEIAKCPMCLRVIEKKKVKRLDLIWKLDGKLINLVILDGSKAIGEYRFGSIIGNSIIFDLGFLPQFFRGVFDIRDNNGGLVSVSIRKNAGRIKYARH